MALWVSVSLASRPRGVAMKRFQACILCHPVSLVPTVIDRLEEPIQRLASVANHRGDTAKVVHGPGEARVGRTKEPALGLKYLMLCLPELLVSVLILIPVQGSQSRKDRKYAGVRVAQGPARDLQSFV